MDFTDNLGAINLLVVFLATVASNVLGGLWYSPFAFGKPWAKANNIELGTSGIQNVPLTFAASFVMTLLAASMIAALLAPTSTGAEGMRLGAVLGVTMVVTTMGITNLFERRPPHLIAINSGFHLTSFVMMGFIIGSLS